MVCKPFSPSLQLVFSFTWCFSKWRHFKFDEIQFTNFFLLQIILWCYMQEKSLSNPRPHKFSPRFCAISFIVFSFTFRYTFHFELIFAHSVKYMDWHSLFTSGWSTLPSLEKTVFTECSLHVYKNKIKCIYVYGSISGLYFYFIDLFAYIYTNTTLS